MILLQVNPSSEEGGIGNLTKFFKETGESGGKETVFTLINSVRRRWRRPVRVRIKASPRRVAQAPRALGNPHTTPTSDPPPPPNPFSEPRGARGAPQTRRSRQGEGPAAEETPGPRKAAGTELRAPRSPAEPLGPGRCYGAEPRGGRCREPRVNSGNGGGADAEARGGRRRWGAAPEGHGLNLPLLAVVIIKGAWIRQGNTGCLCSLGQCRRWCAKCWC